MEIKKSTTYAEFIDIMKKSHKVESMRVTPDVSVVCIDADYYEMDAHKQTFGKLRLVSAMSYQRGTVVPEDRLKALKKVGHDVEAASGELPVTYFLRS